MKRVNIYLNYKAKKRLDELKEKYHISYSTIINIVTEKYYMVIGNQLEEHYLYEKKGLKTSIKPKHIERYKRPSIVMTNAITIFIEKELPKYLEDEKLREKVNNFIYDEFQNTYEINYDGNRLNRLMPKMIKNNKEYYRKLLEE